MVVNFSEVLSLKYIQHIIISKITERRTENVAKAQWKQLANNKLKK